MLSDSKPLAWPSPFGTLQPLGMYNNPISLISNDEHFTVYTINSTNITSEYPRPIFMQVSLMGIGLDIMDQLYDIEGNGVVRIS